MKAFPILLIIAILIMLILAANLSSSRKDSSYQANQGYRALCKSENNRIIAGVCGGIAEYFGLDAVIVRLFFILSGVGLLTYLILTITIPNQPSPCL